MPHWMFLVVLGACSYAPQPAAGDGSMIGDDDAMPDGPPPGVWLHPYKHRKAFSVIGNKVPSGPGLIDFPIVVALTDGDLGAGALAADGRDIAFTDSDALTVLDSEIASFSAGKLQAWIRMPTLTATNRTLFMYYGHTSPPAPNPTSVWTNSFAGEWHFEQAPNPATGNEMLDSSAGNRKGSADLTMTPANSVIGQLGRSINYDGVDDTIVYSAINLTNTFTISAWVNVDTGAGIRTIFANAGPGGSTDGFRFFINSPGTADKKLIIETGDGGNGSLCTTAGGAIAPSVFEYVVAVIDRGGRTGKIFVNGTDVTMTGAAIQDGFNNTTGFEIGSLKNDIQAGMTGVIDEVSIASVLRPPEWIATAFSNQSVPGAFFTPLGAEEQEP